MHPWWNFPQPEIRQATPFGRYRRDRVQRRVGGIPVRAWEFWRNSDGRSRYAIGHLSRGGDVWAFLNKIWMGSGRWRLHSWISFVPRLLVNFLIRAVNYVTRELHNPRLRRKLDKDHGRDIICNASQTSLISVWLIPAWKRLIVSKEQSSKKNHRPTCGTFDSNNRGFTERDLSRSLAISREVSKVISEGISRDISRGSYLHDSNQPERRINDGSVTRTYEIMRLRRTE